MSDSGTLRDQQAEFTRQMLMEAAKRVIDKNPVDEFSVQKVAEEAGVSHRTIYRYFPSRQELLDAFTDWMEDTVAPVKPYRPETMEDISTAIRQAFNRFDRYAPYFRAGLILASRGEPIQPHRQKDRDQMIRDALADLLEPLDEDRAEEVYAVIRHLVGASTWYSMHDRFDLKDGRAGEAIAWAVEVLIDAVKEGRVPSAVQATTPEVESSGE